MNEDQIVAALNAVHSAGEQEIEALRNEVFALTRNLEATVDRHAGSRDAIVRMRKKLRGQKERLRVAHERREELEQELKLLTQRHAAVLEGIAITLRMLGYGTSMDPSTDE